MEKLPYRFHDEKREIRFHQFDLPSPWINYLSNGRMHAFVSQAGGGMTWWLTPMLFRISRYRFYNLPIDSPGFYVYIRMLWYLASQQFEDGHSVHTAWPEENRPPQDITRSDDHIWMVYLVYAIAAETGDLGFLDKEIPFLAPDLVTPVGGASLWEHLLRGWTSPKRIWANTVCPSFCSVTGTTIWGLSDARARAKASWSRSSTSMPCASSARWPNCGEIRPLSGVLQN